MRPGSEGKLGLDAGSLQQLNPRLVHCSITGFGADGPYADRPAFDNVGQALSGWISMFHRGTDARVPGPPVSDTISGIYACVGILAALRHREATGRGQLVELDLLSVLLSSMVNQSAGFTLAGSVPQPMGNRHPSIAPYEVFPTVDQPIVLAVGNDRQFRRLCSVLDVPELATDSRFLTNSDRVEHVDELFEVLSARLRTRPAQHWFETLTPLGVPCGPVNDVAHAFALAESLDLKPTATIGDMTLVANPIRLSRTPVTYRLRPPKLEQ